MDSEQINDWEKCRSRSLDHAGIGGSFASPQPDSTMTPRKLIQIVSSLALCSGLHAQVAQRVISVGDPVPGLGGEVANSIHSVGVNSNGGYSIHLRTTAIGDDNYIFGNATGGPPSILLQQGMHAGKVQHSWSPFGHGFANDGTPVIRAVLGGSFLQSIWHGNQVVATEGDSPGLKNLEFGGFAYPSIAHDSNEVAFVADLIGKNGAADRKALFLGSPANPVVMGLQSIPGVPLPLAPECLWASNYDVSEGGSHWIATVLVADGSSALILDGDLHSIGGSPVVTHGSIPPSLGVGNWGSPFAPQVNEAGTVAFLRNTGGQHSIIRDGEVLVQGGDYPMHIPIVEIHGFDLNELGQIAYTARVSDGSDYLAVEDQVLVREGHPVDMDGDGVPEPGTTVTELIVSGNKEEPRISTDGRVYFIAQVDIAGTPNDPSDDLEGVYSVAFDSLGPDRYCAPTPSSEGCLGHMRFTGVPSATQASIFSIAALGVRKDTIGVLGYSLGGKDRIPFKGGSLCITPPIHRTTPVNTIGVQPGPCTGALATPFNAYIQSGANPALQAGAQVFVQWFYRDPGDPQSWGLTNAGHFVIRN